MGWDYFGLDGIVSKRGILSCVGVVRCIFVQSKIRHCDPKCIVIPGVNSDLEAWLREGVNVKASDQHNHTFFHRCFEKACEIIGKIFAPLGFGVIALKSPFVFVFDHRRRGGFNARARGRRVAKRK